jgi:hypothetical protein
MNFSAEIEEWNAITDTLKWFINGVERIDKRNQLQWTETFPADTYQIEMQVLYGDGETTTVTGTLTIKFPWIKIRNVRQ